MKQLLAVLFAIAALAFAVPGALADGTETLGNPSVTVADGTAVLAAGAGMENFPNTSNSFAVNVPAGATVEQVLFYWQGHFTLNAGTADSAISVDGNAVTGTSIGGPTLFFTWPGGDFGLEMYQSFRADITNLNLVAAGGDTLAISNMNFGTLIPGQDSGNDGAGVLVVYSLPGTAGAVGIRDGLDLAFSGFAPPLTTTVPQTFTFAASSSPRTGTISSLVGSISNFSPVEGFRTNQLRITFNLGGTGDVTLDNPWQSNQGVDFDASNITVTIPANATQMTLQALSGGPAGAPGTNTPASFAWVGAAVTVPEELPPPPPPPGDEGCTPGFWKNHPEAWPATGFTTSQTLSSVFAPAGLNGLGGKTLLQALEFGGGNTLTEKKQNLLRIGVAAVLSAAHPGVDFPMTTAEVIAAVNAALATNNKDTIEALKNDLDKKLNAGCPL
jgi:hypothetical protein